MTITGDIEQTSRTKPSSAVSHSQDCEQIFAVTWGTTLWEWRKNSSYSGGNQHGDVGGKALN
jgi:hypothetical protein